MTMPAGMTPVTVTRPCIRHHTWFGLDHGTRDPDGHADQGWCDQPQQRQFCPPSVPRPLFCCSWFHPCLPPFVLIVIMPIVPLTGRVQTGLTQALRVLTELITVSGPQGHIQGEQDVIDPPRQVVDRVAVF